MDGLIPRLNQEVRPGVHIYKVFVTAYVLWTSAIVVQAESSEVAERLAREYVATVYPGSPVDRLRVVQCEWKNGVLVQIKTTQGEE